MKYLYTTKPDEHCHEVNPGIWGRPVHTTEQAKLRKAGWVFNINQLEESDYGLRKEEGRQESQEVSGMMTVKVDDMKPAFTDSIKAFSSESLDDEVADRVIRDALVEEYGAKFGKPPHHKMKAETIRKKLDESDD